MSQGGPAGERDKGYQRLPFSRTCQAARAKYRGREEPGPGRGLPAQPATQPPLLSRHKPDDTFHHLLSEKRSSQAKWFLPGNLDCVATKTTTSRGGGEHLAKSFRDRVYSLARLGGHKVSSPGWYIRS